MKHNKIEKEILNIYVNLYKLLINKYINVYSEKEEKEFLTNAYSSTQNLISIFPIKYSEDE